MNHTLCFLLALTLPLAVANAQSDSVPVHQRQSRTSDVDYLMSNVGQFGPNLATNNIAHFVPRDSGRGYIFGAGIWFGARKRVAGELRNLSFITYNTRTGASWAYPDENHTVPSGVPATPYYSRDYDRSTGLPRAAGLPNWPMWQRPGITPTLLSPGNFVRNRDMRDPSAMGLAPAFVPGVAEQFSTRFTDSALSKYEGQVQPGLPIGLCFNQNVYSWTGGFYRNSVVLTYEIINISPDTLFDCSIGSLVDADIGTSSDDRTAFYAFRPDLRTATFWSDGNGLHGTLTTTILEGPVVDARGFIDNRLRGRYRKEGRVGTFRNWAFDDAMDTSRERYDQMTTGQFDGDLGPADRRQLLGTTIFHMRPFDTARFSVAFCVHTDIRSVNTSAPNATIEQFTARLIDSVYGTFAAVGQLNSRGTEPLRAVPNPASDMTTFEFSPIHPGRSALHIVDRLGRSVLSRELGIVSPETLRFEVDLTELEPGVYMGVIESGSARHTVPIIVVR